MVKCNFISVTITNYIENSNNYFLSLIHSIIMCQPSIFRNFDALLNLKPSCETKMPPSRTTDILNISIPLYYSMKTTVHADCKFWIKLVCLFSYRCVKQEDKSLSLGFSEVIVALLAFMPGPVLYGTIVGKYIEYNNYDFIIIILCSYRHRRQYLWY